MMYRLIALVVLGFHVSGAAAERPNILWVTSEDNGPQLGAYGDEYAVTPNLDALAAKSLRYQTCWSNAPVCAPARTTIIAGLYPTATGGQHMRSSVQLPESFEAYPVMLRRAGYWCTNNSKTDYNYSNLDAIWDENGRKAHWRNRPDPQQPFMAVFNITVSHESQIRKRPHTAVHDPAKAPIPAYHPDTPEVRQDWAQYYDKMTEMDAQIGRVLDELEADGLTEETIVFYYGDHGSGMPRNKRWPYNSGLHVPLIVHVPEKFRHLAPQSYKPGNATDQLVAFVDLYPTLLSLAGIPIPDHLHGTAFLGEAAAAPKPYLFGFRGRMDERYDCVRTIRDQRYIYIRNFMPHEIYGQYIAYMFQTPTTQVWNRLFKEGRLNAAQSAFWLPKPTEELYDLENDPDEVVNLAQDPAYADKKAELADALRQWMFSMRDVGLLPEAEMHARAEGSTIYETTRDPDVYPFEAVYDAAVHATAEEKDPSRLARLTRAHDAAVRYYGAQGIMALLAEGQTEDLSALRPLLNDPSPSVRIVAAEAVGRFGSAAAKRQSVNLLVDLADVEQHSVFTAVAALNALQTLEPLGPTVQDALRDLPREAKQAPSRVNSYVGRLLDSLTAVQ